MLAFLLVHAVRPCLFLITTSQGPPNSAAPCRHLCTSLWQGLSLQALARGPGRGLELKPCFVQRGWAPLPGRPLCCPRARGIQASVWEARAPSLSQTLLLLPAVGHASPPPCLAFPVLPCPSPIRRVSGVPPDDSHLGLGAWSLHIPRACPVLPNPGPEGSGLGSGEEGPGGPDGWPQTSLLPSLVWPCSEYPHPGSPVLDLMAHVVGATQARIDIFREKERYF